MTVDVVIWRLEATIEGESPDRDWTAALLWCVYARYLRSEYGSRKRKGRRLRQLKKKKKKLERL